MGPKNLADILDPTAPDDRPLIVQLSPDGDEQLRLTYGEGRRRIAALALRQVEFGAVSLLPVRFAGSRIAGPIADGGRVIYCVSGRMYGRTFGKPERPRVVLLDDNDRLITAASTTEKP